MKILQRYDFIEIKASKTDEGFLRDSPVVGRVGIQEYRKTDGSVRRELRLPEEVFNPDSLASFIAKPITVDHPNGMVSSKNAHKVTVGAMLASGKQDGDTVRADIVIHSPESIGDRRQLSLGYTAEMDETPGEWNGQKYDAIQRNIRVNHLSVVKSARAGAIARLNLDSNEELLPTVESVIMTIKVKLDNGIEYDAVPEIGAALTQLRTDVKDAAVALQAEKTKTAKIEAERDSLKARVDAFDAEIKKAKADGQAEAAARAKLETVAANFKVDSKDLTERQIKELIVKSVRADADLKDKSDAYIDAAFDIAVEAKKDIAMASQRKDANNPVTTGAYKTSQQRYDEQMSKLAEEKAA